MRNKGTKNYIKRSSGGRSLRSINWSLTIVIVTRPLSQLKHILHITSFYAQECDSSIGISSIGPKLLSYHVNFSSCLQRVIQHLATYIHHTTACIHGNVTAASRVFQNTVFPQLNSISVYLDYNIDLFVLQFYDKLE